MGIKVEFNPDLALRNIAEYKAGRRKIEECLPEKMVVGEVYDFLKSGQRCYWFGGELALLETFGGEKLSSPLASIKILETTHFLDNGEVWTKGKYQVMEVFTDNEIRFNWMKKV